MKNKKQVFIKVSVILVFFIMGYLYFTRPTIENICLEKGFTIVNQEPLDIVLSIPQTVISEEAYSLEGQTFGNGVVVYEKESSRFLLKKISAVEEDDSLFELSFEANYHLEKNGKIILPYWVREDGYFVWNTFLEPQMAWEKTEDSESYTLYLSTGDRNGEFTLLIDKRLIVDNNEFIEIPVCANELLYMKGEIELSPNSEPMSEEKIVRILKSYNPTDIKILDVVQTPESECGIIGVVIYRYCGRFAESKYNIAFVRKGDKPSELDCDTMEPCTIHDLEYIGKDSITYAVEIDRNDHKEHVKYNLTLVLNSFNETFFDHYIVDESIYELTE